MLFLTRKIGQSVIIDGDIEVFVKEIKTEKGGEPIVILGFDAPSSVIINRREVEDRYNPKHSERNTNQNDETKTQYELDDLEDLV